MAYNDVLSKAEEAMKSVVDGLGLTGVTVNTGMDDTTLEAPYVVCSASGAEEEVVRHTGILRVNCSIRVCSLADAEDLATHRTRVATVFDALRYSDVADTLSAAASDFHVFESSESGRESVTEDRKIMDILNLDLVCCGSSIS